MIATEQTTNMRACLPHYQSAGRARFHWKWENWFWFQGLTLKFRHPLRRRRKSDGLTDGLLNASSHKSNNTRGSTLVLNAVNSSLNLFRFWQMDERIGHGPIYSPWTGCVSGWMRSWRRRWHMADWLIDRKEKKLPRTVHWSVHWSSIRQCLNNGSANRSPLRSLQNTGLWCYQFVRSQCASNSYKSSFVKWPVLYNPLMQSAAISFSLLEY